MKITTAYADGRVEVRDATPEEIAADEQMRQEQLEIMAADQERRAVLETTVANARQKFVALGFTDEEIDLFIP